MWLLIVGSYTSIFYNGKVKGYGWGFSGIWYSIKIFGYYFEDNG